PPDPAHGQTQRKWASPRAAPMTHPPMRVKGSSTPAPTSPPAATSRPVAGTKAPMTTSDSKKVTAPRITPAHMALRAMKSAAEVSKLSILILCPRAYGIRPYKGNAAMRRPGLKKVCVAYGTHFIGGLTIDRRRHPGRARAQPAAHPC